MKVYINLKEVEIRDNSTVAEMLEQCGYKAGGLAVAVSDKVIPRKFWAAETILPCSKITIIKAVCGG